MLQRYIHALADPFCNHFVIPEWHFWSCWRELTTPSGDAKKCQQPLFNFSGLRILLVLLDRIVPSLLHFTTLRALLATRYACRHHPRPHCRVSPPCDPVWALSRPHIAPPPDPPGPPPISVGKATTAPCGTHHTRAGHTLRCSRMVELRCYKDSYWMLQEMIYAVATSDRFLFYVFNLWFLMLQHIILDVLKCKC